MKEAETKADTLEEKVVHLGKEAVQNKMSVVGVIASGLSICMYVSYIPQSLEICPDIRETGFSRSLHLSTARCGLDMAFSKRVATGRLFCQSPRHYLWSDGCNHRPSLNAQTQRSTQKM